MKLEKAIELLKLDIENIGEAPFQDLKDAEKLGIEALRREKEYRLTRGDGTFDLLPGETEE